MGCCGSKDNDKEEDKKNVEEEELDVSNDVDLQLLEQQIKELFKFKILLLGAGESGKSTVVKQIKLIHKKRLPAKELALVGTSLHQNTVDCMKALLQALKVFDSHEIRDEEDKKTANLIMNHDENSRLTPDMGDRILKLWESEAVQNAYSRRNEFWLLDSFPYYIKNLRRFCEEDYVPTEEDTVMARIRTTGIVVTNVESKINKEHKDEPEALSFQVVDVGGQRNERKKWMHCFDDVAAILFIVNLAGYNQVMFEDNSKNRMEEELELFAKVTHNPIFAETPIFLFLNKKDLFETMIKEKDMVNVFPDYKGGMHLESALTYIQEAFQKQCPPGKTVNVEIVTASYRRDIKCAFENVKTGLYGLRRKALLAKVAKIRQEQRRIFVEKQKKEQGCCGSKKPKKAGDNKAEGGKAPRGSKHDATDANDDE